LDFAVLDFAVLAFAAPFLGAERGGAFPTFLRAEAEAARFTEDFAFADDFLTLERAFAMTASRWDGIGKQARYTTVSRRDASCA
jgi:hypothetical protein